MRAGRCFGISWKPCNPEQRVIRLFLDQLAVALLNETLRSKFRRAEEACVELGVYCPPALTFHCTPARFTHTHTHAIANILEPRRLPSHLNMHAHTLSNRSLNFTKTTQSYSLQLTTEFLPSHYLEQSLFTVVLYGNHGYQPPNDVVLHEKTAVSISVYFTVDESW